MASVVRRAAKETSKRGPRSSNALRALFGRLHEDTDSVRQTQPTSVRRRGSDWRNNLTSSATPSGSVLGSPRPRGASLFAHCDGRCVTSQLMSVPTGFVAMVRPN